MIKSNNFNNLCSSAELMRKYNGYYSTTSTKYILALAMGYSLDNKVVKTQTMTDKVLSGTGKLVNFDDM